MKSRLKRIISLYGPHELLALALFIYTIAIWAVTLAQFR